MGNKFRSEQSVMGQNDPGFDGEKGYMDQMGQNGYSGR
jgi:hypothetical protein